MGYLKAARASLFLVLLNAGALGMSVLLGRQMRPGSSARRLGKRVSHPLASGDAGGNPKRYYTEKVSSLTEVTASVRSKTIRKAVLLAIVQTYLPYSFAVS